MAVLGWWLVVGVWGRLYVLRGCGVRDGAVASREPLRHWCAFRQGGARVTAYVVRIRGRLSNHSEARRYAAKLFTTPSRTGVAKLPPSCSLALCFFFFVVQQLALVWRATAQPALLTHSWVSANTVPPIGAGYWKKRPSWINIHSYPCLQRRIGRGRVSLRMASGDHGS